ncbi:MAG: hypothetical protein LBI45_07195 [Bacteroidales bacterium]|jgi:hypothetical protein|nr:hypothetical protein [Bacteroidales bacterium]
MITIILILASLIIGIIFGIYIQKGSAIVVTDRFTPNRKRTNKQIAIDGVMQLSNEIAESGALQFSEMSNGDIQVILKVMK